MAWQTAEKFLELLAADRILRTHQRLDNAWSTPELIRFAKKKGFLFSAADLETAMKSFVRQQQAAKR